MTDFNRREFMQRTALTGAGLSLFTGGLVKTAMAYPYPQKNAVSLALWSLVQSFRAGVLKLPDVARICREDFGIDGIEYVTSFFEAPVERYLKKLNRAAARHGVKNVLIMVDGEGSMVARDKKVRHQAAINHRKWVDVAAYLGCHAIRCNTRGGGKTPQEDPDALNRAADSFGALIEYAKESKINVLIENHGGLSSYPNWLPNLMKKVNSPHFGILPDYGNYEQTPDADVYEAVRLAMPYAKGVSVKANWQSDWTHPQYDLAKLVKVSVESGYTGFWGVESIFRRSKNKKTTDPDQAKADDWQAVRRTQSIIKKVVGIK